MNSVLTRRILPLAGLLALAVSSLPAATVTWSGASGGDWNAGGNWGGSKPASADTAVFSTAITSVTNAAADQAVTSIQFGTASVGSITLGSVNGNKLLVNTGGSISILNTITTASTTETINAPIVLTPSTGTSNVAYSFSNAATTTTVTMAFGGSISGGTTTGTAALTLTGANGGANTVSGLISDGGASGGLSVIKGSSGKWVLSNDSNSFTGGVSINSGTLSTTSIGTTGSASALGTNGTIKVGSQGSTTLLYTGLGETSNKDIQLQGTNGLGFYSSGSGALTLSGNITTTGAGGVNNNLQLRGSGGATIAAPNTITGVISDGNATLSIIKNDTNMWSLAGANTYTGTTTVNNGTLLVGNGGTTGQLGTGNVIMGANGNLSFDRSNALSVNNAISGTGTIQQIGSGTTTLTGANTFTSIVTLSAGTLSVSTIGNGGVASGNLGSATNAAANLVFNGGALEYTGVDASTDRNFTINSGKVATFNIDTSNLTVSGSSTSTTGGLTKTGAGTLTLSGTNLHTGATTISAGTLSVATIGNGGSSGSNLSKAANDAANLVFDGGALQYTGATASTDRNFTINSGKTATFDVTTNSLTVSGNSTATSGALAKIGAGTLILSGVNLYTGGTSVSDGTLRLSGNERLDNTGAITVSGGILNLGGGTQTTSGAVALTSGTIQNGTLTQNGGTYDVRSGAVSSHLAGTGDLAKSTSGTVTFSNSNSYSGGTAINGGILSVSADNQLGTAAGTVSFGGGTLQVTGTGTITSARETTLNAGGGTFDIGSGLTVNWNGDITGSSGNTLTKAGSGNLVLGGSNDYAGDTYVTAGVLRLGVASALSPNTVLHVSSGASFDANGFTQSVSDLSGSGAVDVGAGLTVGTSGTSSFDGSLGGTGGFTMNGSGTLTLNSANTYGGGTAITSGTVKLGADGALPSGTTVAVSSGATLDLNSHAASVSKLEGAGGITLGSASLTVDQADDTTFGGAITGGGGFEKSGAGKLILSGLNDYTGATSITGGTLIVNGSLAAASTVTVGGNATLGGSGTIGGDTVIEAGGTLSPGNSPGLQTFSGNLTLGGTTLMEISGVDRGSTYDAINVGGTLTYGGELHVTFGTSVSDGNIFGLFSALDGTSAPVSSGSFSSVVFDGSGYDATLVYTSGLWRAYNLDGHDFTFSEATGALSVAAASVPVPEPSTYALIAGALALLGVAVRRYLKRRSIFPQAG